MNKIVRDQTDRCPMPKTTKTRNVDQEEEMMNEIDDFGMKEVVMEKMEEKVKEEEYPDDCYKMNHTHRGNAVILYHETFENKDLKTRIGVEDDVKTLRRSLLGLGFQVDSHKDLTYDEIKAVLEKVAKKNHDDNDCLLVVVMTYGRGRDYIHAKDEEYRMSELWETFNHKLCPTLKGKPKIFFVQQDVNNTGNVEAKKFCFPDQTDCFVVQCTETDSYEGRDEGQGSFVIECLCKELDENGKLKDLFKIITAVNKHLNVEGKKKLEIHSNLQRELYL